MAHEVHSGDHTHEHGPACGHVAVHHGDHIDYLHEGHLHHPHEGHVDEHVIAADEAHPTGHTAPIACDAAHRHGAGCGHEAVPHDDHVDYLVDGRLHRPHEGHCDDHGPLATV